MYIILCFVFFTKNILHTLYVYVCCVTSNVAMVSTAYDHMVCIHVYICTCKSALHICSSYILQFMQKIHTACVNYNKWKASNNPEFKPWLNPDQNPLPLVSKCGDYTCMSPLSLGNFIHNALMPMCSNSLTIIHLYLYIQSQSMLCCNVLSVLPNPLTLWLGIYRYSLM